MDETYCIYVDDEYVDNHVEYDEYDEYVDDEYVDDEYFYDFLKI